MSSSIKRTNIPLHIYFFLFMLYSFIGWIYETVLFSVQDHAFINRGFNFGPYIPIYGFGAVIIMYMIVNIIGDQYKIRKVNIRPLAVFLLIGFISTIAELLASHIMEYGFGIIMWDYSGYWLNFQGRIAFRTSFIFAAGGTFFFYAVQPPAKKLLDTIFPTKQKQLAKILFCVVAVDFVVSVVTTVWFPDMVDHPGVIAKTTPATTTE
ncbi:MAG: putative ABC transporter permease [Azoarcus sp.]|nr:putative ABC transporter permease [Azoarcus sp.]